MLRYLIGKWRLLWNLCPECNFDAPSIYDCPVCFNINRFHDKSEKQILWKRFICKPVKGDFYELMDYNVELFDGEAYDKALIKWEKDIKKNTLKE